MCYVETSILGIYVQAGLINASTSIGIMQTTVGML